MSAKLTREIYDHHNAQRIHALRGYARHADRLDGRADINWLLVLLCLVAFAAAAVALNLHSIIGGL